MTCISGPPCRPGNTAEFDPLRDIRVVAQDHAAARAAQRLVRRRRDDMRVRQRARMRAAGDQPGEMRHVDHQIGADPVGDRAEPGEIDDARIGAAAGDDQPRPVLLGQTLDLRRNRSARPRRARRNGPRETTCPTGSARRRASDARRRRATCRGPCRRASAAPETPPDWPAPRHAAAHWRSRTRTAASRARSPAARRHRRTRSRRNSGGRDSLRHICSSAPSLAPRAPRARRCSRWRSARSATAGGEARPRSAAATSGSAAARGVAKEAGIGLNGRPDSRGYRQDSTSCERDNTHIVPIRYNLPYFARRCQRATRNRVIFCCRDESGFPSRKTVLVRAKIATSQYRDYPGAGRHATKSSRGGVARAIDYLPAKVSVDTVKSRYGL